IAAAKKIYNLADDQIFELNSYWLEVLNLSKATLPPCELRINTLKKYNEQRREMIYKKLKDSDPSIKKISTQEYSEDSNRILQECRKHFPDVEFDDKNTEVYLSEKQIEILASGKKLTVNGKSITLNDLTYTDGFYVVGKIMDIAKAKI